MIRSLMALCITALVCDLALGAEIVFHNGKVVTQWRQNPVAQAFLVSGNHFAKVGSNHEVLAAATPGSKRVDLHGRTVLPGLNDSHTHPIGDALSELDEPVPVMHSIADVQAYLKKLAAQAHPGNVLFVPKVYSTRLVDRHYPTRYELDEAVGDREAMTDNGYASVLNSALLKRLNITRDTPQPANGKIIKDDKGDPTGLILGAAQLLGPLRTSRTFSDAERLKALKTMQATYNRVGITSTGDRGQRADGFRTYQELKRRGEMTVRTAVTYLINAGGKPAEVKQTIENSPFVTGWGDEWVRVGALKTVVDGGILIGTAYLREPYGDNTEVYGSIPNIAAFSTSHPKT